MPSDSTSMLLILRLRIALWNSCESLCVAWRYWRTNWQFCKSDWLLALHSGSFRTLSRLCREAGADELSIWGETPLTAIAEVAARLDLQPSDCFYDLGSGRGRLLFWLYYFVGCRTVGIERSAALQEFAREVTAAMEIRSHFLTLLQEDLYVCDLSEATVIYLYGTTMSDGQIDRWIDGSLRSAAESARILTVSWPLSDYAPDLYETIDQIEVGFPWGKAKIFTNKKITLQQNR